MVEGFIHVNLSVFVYRLSYVLKCKEYEFFVKREKKRIIKKKVEVED